MTMRSVARVCAAGLLSAGALTFAATPALAADVDLGVDIKGTTVALGAEAKPITITVSNNGSVKPSEVKIKFDARDVNLGGKAVVDLGGDGEDDCKLDGQGHADCVLAESAVPAPGGSVDLTAYIRKVAGDATGKAGKLTVSIEVAGDSDKKNDSDTADITLSGNKGVDLTVYAEDVTLNDGDKFTGEPIPAGGKSVTEAFVTNYGDQTAAGFRVVGALPKGATFVDQEAEGCDFSADRRSVLCEVEAGWLSLPPQTAAAVRFGIVVAQDVEGPVSLQDGSWTFVATQAVDPDRARLAKQALPDYVFQVDPAELAHMDVDPSDNVDGFAVLVAGPSGGTGGGDGGGDGDGPGLPVTGPVAGGIAGAGGAVLIAGAVMFLVSRRRRVVLVTPRDGK